MKSKRKVSSEWRVNGGEKVRGGILLIDGGGGDVVCVRVICV